MLDTKQIYYLGSIQLKKLTRIEWETQAYTLISIFFKLTNVGLLVTLICHNSNNMHINKNGEMSMNNWGCSMDKPENKPSYL